MIIFLPDRRRLLVVTFLFHGGRLARTPAVWPSNYTDPRRSPCSRWWTCRRAVSRRRVFVRYLCRWCRLPDYSVRPVCMEGWQVTRDLTDCTHSDQSPPADLHHDLPDPHVTYHSLYYKHVHIHSCTHAYVCVWHSPMLSSCARLLAKGFVPDSMGNTTLARLLDGFWVGCRPFLLCLRCGTITQQ